MLNHPSSSVSILFALTTSSPLPRGQLDSARSRGAALSCTGGRMRHVASLRPQPLEPAHAQPDHLVPHRQL